MTNKYSYVNILDTVAPSSSPVRTPDSHSGDRGSNPLGATSKSGYTKITEHSILEIRECNLFSTSTNLWFFFPFTQCSRIMINVLLITKGANMNTPIEPIFKKLLIVATVIFVAGVSYTLTNLCIKVSALEHTMAHVAEKYDINH